MARVSRAVSGKERAVIVFWAYCIAGTLIAGVLMFLAFRLVPTRDRSLGSLVTGALFVAYFLWAHVSLWTCAFNVEWRGWGYAARCYVVVVVVLYFVGVTQNFEFGSSGIAIRRVF
jgi:hypothetical protein